jgi:hypothetical protein
VDEAGARNRGCGNEREDGSAEYERHRKVQKSEATRLYQLCAPGPAASVPI